MTLNKKEAKWHPNIAVNQKNIKKAFI